MNFMLFIKTITWGIAIGATLYSVLIAIVFFLYAINLCNLRQYDEEMRIYRRFPFLPWTLLALVSWAAIISFK